MAATPCRRRRLKLPALLTAVLLALLPAARSRATTFDTGPEVGQRLLQNVVRIEARDLPEHGFGLVVGADRDYVYIATARHVVAKRAPAGLAEPERASREIAVSFCALPAAPRQVAAMLDGFDGADDDLALLRTARPLPYAPQLKALAPAGQDGVGEQAWQLGRELDCVVVPTPGVIATHPDARHTMRVDLHGALGGASGGPLVSGYGIVGLVK
ncbi:MAG: serine protease, partial [Pseudomonadota bacterium]|nr:serine protease [Pseudomonadota bacterium]